MALAASTPRMPLVPKPTSGIGVPSRNWVVGMESWDMKPPGRESAHFLPRRPAESSRPVPPGCETTEEKGIMEPMPVIDCHGHVGAGFDERLLHQADQLGVDTLVLSNISMSMRWPDEAEIERRNAEMAQIVAAHPGRVEGYAYVNPRHRNALDVVRRGLEDQGLIGLKLWIATTIDDALVDPIAELAAEYNAPILAHTWDKVDTQLAHETRPANLENAARRHPDTTFIAAHMGGRVERGLPHFVGLPNVYVDTCGTLITAREVALTVERVGADHTLFGSDLEGGCLAVNVGKVLAADLDQADFDLVMGNTMHTILQGVRR
ncbi:hypothetical protein CGZ92_05355 [Parenemella sanctibonifatiensis]|uniref:Amidohydrolase-related domain-containing protein n=2 Tax=Parenemella sanctibonifatiensis TaxID=2016505 RepID=A0A255E960_9ACTN|nr:hypothetical protein CGZ92_05355 [Parenemella sanctibonifatiensis]